MAYKVEPNKCAKDGCKKSYTPHEWDTTQANRDGWFIQRNGQAWCPSHHPEWVAEWRAKQFAKREAKRNKTTSIKNIWGDNQ